MPDGAAQRRRREHAGTLHRVVVLEDGFAWEGRSTVFPGMPMHYLSKRYVLRGGKPMLFAVGVHGQNLFVDRQNEIPIARSGGPDYVPPGAAHPTMARCGPSQPIRFQVQFAIDRVRDWKKVFALSRR